MLWWWKAGQEFLFGLFKHFLEPYVQDLDMNQVNLGIMNGHLVLRDLKLKREALDKFHLPVDVSEGYLGTFSVSFGWTTLASKPVDVTVENLFLLAVPASPEDDPDEYEKRNLAVKLERLKSADLLQAPGTGIAPGGDSQTQAGFIWSLLLKILSNVQLTVNNVHIRYEDKQSSPDHPFAAGLTLSAFKMLSVDENWRPAFTQNIRNPIYKLASLDSLAIYFDTDATSIVDLTNSASKEIFRSMIASDSDSSAHKFFLRPVSGEGKVTANPRHEKSKPRFDIHLRFEELRGALDALQWRDVISFTNMNRIYLRRQQFLVYRPRKAEIEANKARALLTFAIRAVVDQVHQRNRVWSWSYFSERRDNRKHYIRLYKEKLKGSTQAEVTSGLDDLERFLSYRDIKFYRSIAQSQLGKELEYQRQQKKKLEEERKAQQGGGWAGWLWGGSSTAPDSLQTLQGELSDDQRKELYAAVDFDERAVLAEAFEDSREYRKAFVDVKLKRGSFALLGPKESEGIISASFSEFGATFVQRSENFEGEVSLGDLSVFNDSQVAEPYRQILRVQDAEQLVNKEASPPEGFFYFKFEHCPLDERADNAVTMRLRHTEIIYHKSTLENVYRFFKDSGAQPELVDVFYHAASQTMQTFRDATRASLEYALETHKTIDVQMDLKAPLIIVPESLSSANSRRLVVDAGHISVVSKLVDRKATRGILEKRNQPYSADDFHRLESLMYDQFILKLDDAQISIGYPPETGCSQDQKLAYDPHLLERTSINLTVQSSIVPLAANIAQFRATGSLPQLCVNFSDAKYEALMGFMAAAIPDLGSGSDSPAIHMDPDTTSSFFNQAHHDTADDVFPDNSQPDGNKDSSAWVTSQQHMLELEFVVSSMSIYLHRSSESEGERPIGEVTFQKFRLALAKAVDEMRISASLRMLKVNIHHNDGQLALLSSELEDTASNDLMTIKYLSVDRESPKFETVFEGVSQDIAISLSTMIFQVAPEPVISLYDFIMSTFSNKSSTSTAGEPAPKDPIPNPEGQENQTSETSKSRIRMRLQAIRVVLIDNDVPIGVLALSTADAAVTIVGSAIDTSGRLGTLSLVTGPGTGLQPPQSILSIEGENLVDFKYSARTVAEEDFEGTHSELTLHSASVILQVVEQPLRDIAQFLRKLAHMKELYDAATQAAVESAASISRLQFNIEIQSPVVIFPLDSKEKGDRFVMELGQFEGKNHFVGTTNEMTIGLRGIHVESFFRQTGELSNVKILEDVTTDIQISQNSVTSPNSRIAINVSDINVSLSRRQFHSLLSVLESVSRIMDSGENGVSTASPISESSQSGRDPTKHEAQDPPPEIRHNPQSPVAISVDLVVQLPTMRLQLFDSEAFDAADYKSHGIVRLTLRSTTFRVKTLTDGTLELEFALQSITIRSIIAGNSKFREIIPPAEHTRNQLMVLYTSPGGPDNEATLLVTVDSPKCIFAPDPIRALLDFLPPTNSSPNPAANSPDSADAAGPSQLNVRVDLQDFSMSVLADDCDINSPAIQLTVTQMVMTHQKILALSLSKLGMSLIQMNKAAEDVKFLDDLDLALSMDSSASTKESRMAVTIDCRPIVFRTSYRDILVISTITNRMVEALGRATGTPEGTIEHSTKSDLAKQSPFSEHPRAIITKEQLTARIDGIRVVLIGDIHEQPLLHIETDPIDVLAKDWTSSLYATAAVGINVRYWNLANSHWEPLLDPWSCSLLIRKETPTSGTVITLSSKQRLDLNISSTFAELAIGMANSWQESQQRILRKGRGGDAPYRIRNLTGSALNIWSDFDGSHHVKQLSTIRLAHGDSIDWRFDDWKTMRESTSAGNNSIGIQFIGKAWEQLRSLSIDTVGEYAYTLRPRLEKVSDRLLCEVSIHGSVKVVTLRSTYKLVNKTMYTVELTLVDDKGHPVYGVERLAPGQDYAVPIEAVIKNRIRVQPDAGFRYKWSTPIRWEDLISHPTQTIKCSHADPGEAAFRFQTAVQSDNLDPLAIKYPKMTVVIRTPIELENLLPYDIKYRIYDKDADQNWTSFLRQGGKIPIHAVDLRHLVLLNITIVDSVFKPSDFAIINTDRGSDFEVENRLSVEDNLGRKLNIHLRYERDSRSGDAFKLQIYCPLILVSKVNCPTYFRWVKSAATKDCSGDDTANSSQPRVLLLSNPFPQGKFLVGIDARTWSEPLSFEAHTAETELVIESKTRRSSVCFGLSWHEGPGKYQITKIIRLVPRFVIKNETSEVLCFREHGVPPSEQSSISPGDSQASLWFRNVESKLVTFAHSHPDASWSAPINIENIGAVHFRVSPSRSNPNEEQLLRADVALNGATLFIIVSVEKDRWPFIIENGSDYKIHFCQSTPSTGGNRVQHGTLKLLEPRARVQYAWDVPSIQDKRLRVVVNNQSYDIDLFQVGNLQPFKFHTPRGSRALSFDVRAEKTTQILNISNYDERQSLYKMRREISGSLSRQDSIMGTDAFEAMTEKGVPETSIVFDLAGLGISLINPKLVEVIYLSLTGFKLDYSVTSTSRSLTWNVESLQLDNQLHDAIYPVVLQPTPRSQGAKKNGVPPFIQLSIILLNDEQHGVTFVKYASLLLQTMTIQVDEDFLFAVLDMSKLKSLSWDDDEIEDNVATLDLSTKLDQPAITERGGEAYFELLELQPVQVSISCVRTERVSTETSSSRNPLAFLINVITMTLGNVNDASLRLNALAMKDAKINFTELQERVVYHYRQDILHQLYRVLGSADFLGNPVGLFNNVSSGVADIFYEPFNGVVMHGNRELGIGIAKGTASFLKKTVFGFSDSFTKVTSSMGKGLSAATFDAEYQNRRRLAQRRNKPRHAIYGVTAGAEAFATSIASGVEGVLMKPIEGAEEEGAVGFFKGMGRGLVGAVTKPVIGVFDLASNVSEGIRNTTTVFDAPVRERARIPRVIPYDDVLKSYSYREAQGQAWLWELDRGAFRNDRYVAHLNMPGSDSVIILTKRCILSAITKKSVVEWELPFTRLSGVQIEDTGVRFADKAGKEYDRFVACPDKVTQGWFFSSVAKVVKSYNAKRRIEK